MRWAAFSELMPEINHNSVVGYSLPFGKGKHPFVILLKPPFISDKLNRCYEVIGDVLGIQGINNRQIKGEGSSVLSQMLSVVLFGDYVSYYLALLRGVDPGPVAIIDAIKKRLQ